MPNLDRTGPRGQGPKTGQGRGSCNDEQAFSRQGLNRFFKRYQRRGPGQGQGRGFGRGTGRGIGPCPLNQNED
ncbi:MAG: DUF5320 domain-containing protein [Bacteroidota bacterium]|nr:DUF5320 domain-containing protein [Patescibacteria group bacterium]